MEDIPITTVVGAAGFAAGLVFGGTVQRTNFCTMGAISDVVFMGDWGRLRAWLLAIAVALLGTQALHTFGLVDINGAVYLSADFGWLSAVVGGLIFGFGMTMTGGCGSRSLVRVGGGNLKSLVVVIVMGIFGYMTMRGLIGLWRSRIEGAVNIDLREHALAGQGVVDLLAAAFGTEAESLRWIVVGLVALGLLVFCLRDPAFRSSGRNLSAGVILGLLVPAGWYITGVIGNDEFEPVPLASFTIVAPTADSLQYLMTYTGATVSFGVGVVGGIIVGAFLMALATRTFHVEAFTEAGDMIRHLIGAAMMGVGAVAALGCTIGQGITGVSTLALGSVLALLSIVAGGVLGLRYLEQGSLGGALRSVFARG